ncbi:MAG TPA: tetratricopeptide repeat protein [Candidatus Deferrimicrobiaceae bacterium]|jgi:Tfp pilus assembly protein PilF
MTRRLPLHVAISLALALLVTLLYFRVAHFPFIQVDDTEYVIENQAVHRGLTAGNLAWAFTTFDNANWHPLTWLSYMADVSLFGVNPGGHHLVNLLFHLANTLLLFDLFRRLTGKIWESGLVAALFAVHPLHVESVVWIAERKDVLSTFFFFATMRVYLRYAAFPGAAGYAAVLGSFALGLLSKPMLVTLPFCLLLIDYWPLERLTVASARRLLLEKVPLFALSAAGSVLTILAQREGAAIGSLVHFPFGIRVGNAVVAYVDYLSKAIVPVGLSVFYPHPMGTLSPVRVAVSGILLATMTVLAVVAGRKRRWLAVGWFWYIGTLVPVIGLVQVGTQAMADRYTYIPLVGFFLILAWGGSELAGRLRMPHRMVAGGVLAWILALCACTWNQVAYWRGVGPLFARAVEVTEGNAFAHTVLGAAAFEQGSDNAAIRHLEEALRIHPDFPDAHLNLGLVYERQGKLGAAEAQLREAVRLFPDDAKANFNLWRVLRKLGRAEEPPSRWPEPDGRSGKGAAEHDRAGLYLAGLGKFEEAAEQFRQALRANPDDADASYNLGLAYVKLGRDAESVPWFERAVKHDARDVAARFSLASVYYRLGRIPESVREYEALSRLNPGDNEVRARLRAIRQRNR